MQQPTFSVESPAPGSAPVASPSSAQSAAPGWPRAVLAALNATAALLPLMLGWSFIAFGALGPAGAQVGLTAAAVAVVVGSLAHLALSRAPMPSGASSSSAALLLGACVAQLAHDEAFTRPGSGFVTLLAATSVVVMASGVLLLLLGGLRAGVLVRYVPRPVLAGFMNGVAVLMVMAQLPVIFGAGPGWRASALAACAALCTAAVVALVQRRWPRAPATLIGLGAGSVLALALQSGCAAFAFALGAGAAECRLATMGALQWSWPSAAGFTALAEAAPWQALARHAGTLLGTALLLASVGALESALNLAALDQRLGQRTDPNREFLSLAVANIASGLLAGLPVVALRLRAMASLLVGGQGRRPEALSNLAIVAALFLALPLLAHVPLAVVAGIVGMLAWALVDPWTRQLVAEWWRERRELRAGPGGRGGPEDIGHHADRRWSLAIVATVCVATAVAGLLAGVAAGVLLAMVLFMRAMNRSLVRLRYSAAQISSRRVYPNAVAQQLAPLRARIVVVELEGALFFGNAERLEREAVAAAEGVEAGPAAPTPDMPNEPIGNTDLVLDLRRVSTLDATGALALAQLRERLARAGTVLRLAGVTPENRHGRVMQSQGVWPASAPGAGSAGAAGATTSAWALHADADHAIEAAEQAALLRVAGPGATDGAVPLAGQTLTEGLAPAQLAALEGRLVRRELAAGERLFAQGEEGRSIYLLLQGSVSMLDRASGQRFVSFSPGMCFGETAVLDGSGRTADARADRPSTVLELPAAVLAELEHHDPALAARIYRNLALHLSQRLRGAAAAWRLAAG